MKKVLICDDHSAIRRGLKLLLTDELGDITIREAEDSAEALRLFQNGKWNLIILDVNMPGRGGMEVLSEIRREDKNVPVLMYSMHPEELVAVKSLRQGASGYVSKSASEKELMNAIRTLLGGRKYITAELAEKLVEMLENPEEIAPHEGLSPRELETMMQLAKGCSLSEIAENLSLSVSTISTFKARVMEKTGLKTIADMTHYAVDHKLI
ncbi:MAG: response regulator transcription factor [Bacteroidia bacterium]|nr:response regulator transcription factor [Bacteroidia bacterium]